MQKRLQQIDILRTLAITAVIVIHAMSANYSTFINTPQINYIIAVDQFMRFSVPFFFAVSGYLLAGKYLKNNLVYSDFLKKRALRLLPPYLLYSAIIFVYLNYYLGEKNPNNLLQIIFLGRADYHLYFVPALFFLYLVFPLILFFYRQKPVLTLVCSLIISLDVILFTSLVNQKIISPPFSWTDQDQYVFPFTWIFYFVLGIHLNKTNPAKFKKVLLITTPLALNFAILESLNSYKTTSHLINSTAFTRIPVLIYASFTLTFLIAWQYKIAALFGKFAGFTARIGQKSYSIYLFHTLIIRLLYEVFRADSPFTLIIFTVLAIYFTFTISGVLNRLQFIPKSLPLFSKL